MADALHFSLQKFRQTILTAVAELEFEVRHNQPLQGHCAKSVCCADTASEEPIDLQVHPELPYAILEGRYQALTLKTEQLEATLKQVLQSLRSSSQSQPIVDIESRVEDLLNVQPPQNTRNVVISSMKNTPALAAAVAAAMPPTMELNEEEEEEEVEVEEEVEEEEDQEMEVEEEEEEVEEEVEEEEDQEMEVEEEEEVEDQEMEVEEEEEEEGIEVEEFEYKGRTYQRDAENNVYLEGEPVGTWNGKRILPLPA